MSESRAITRVGRTAGLALLGAALVLVLLAAIGDGRAPAAQVGAAGGTWKSCTIQNVATYPERIHVKCTGLPDVGIWYLAASTRDAAHAARLLSVMSTALVAGQNLSVLYDSDDTDRLPPGCQAGDCRELIAVEMW